MSENKEKRLPLLLAYVKKNKANGALFVVLARGGNYEEGDMVQVIRADQVEGLWVDRKGRPRF